MPSAIVDPLALALALVPPAAPAPADVAPCAVVPPLAPTPLELLLPGTPLASAVEEQGMAVVVVLVVDDVGLVVDVVDFDVVDVVVVDDVDGQGLVLPSSAWSPVPPVLGPDPIPESEPSTIGRRAASAMAWSDRLLPHPAKTVAAHTKATATTHARRPVPRSWEGRGRMVVPAKAPPCRIVLKLPPPYTGPPRERTELL